jgi:AmmeMemoRadiSam system protein A
MSFNLSAGERSILLAEARESIASRLDERKAEWREEDYPALQKPCGAFVTLHSIAGGKRNLRGCIGRMSASLPLRETVRFMAREAAFSDPRFPPLGKGELERCNIEISALSPMELCPDPRQVRVGVHGLYLIRGGRAGVLLPQVPVEQGWNLDQYLDYICVKAGLPAGSCETPGAQLYTFTAVVFSEE